MNERIGKLAGQAWNMVEDTNRPLLFAEKFAELIILECAKVCDSIDVEYEGEDVLATWCADAIKKHFGVETVDDNLRPRSTYFGNDV
jgi:hypothetical protein